MVTFLLVFAVLATAVVLTWTARRSLLDETEADTALIAQLLARSAEFAEQVPRDVENALGEQMIAEATIVTQQVELTRLVKDLLDGGNVKAIRIVDKESIKILGVSSSVWTCPGSSDTIYETSLPALD